jgi:cytochrome c oxidase cbb3-type subunit 1
LHSHYLALFAYWLLILFAGWGGIPNSAPVPVWIPALSTVGTMLAVLAFIAVALNVFSTTGFSFAAARQNTPLGFFLFATAALTVAAFARAAGPLADPNMNLNLTWFSPAIDQLNLYGFFAMTMFGAIYIIMPRLLGLGLPWPRLVRAQLWLSIAGILLIVLPLAIGGLVEKNQLDRASLPFLAVMRSALLFLRVSTVGDLLLFLSHVLFLTNIAGLVIGFYRARAIATYTELTQDLFKTAGARS